MRNLTSRLSLCVLAAFAPALMAQEDTANRTTTESGPALTIRTTDPGLTFLLSARILMSGNTPDLQPGQAARFTMDRSGEFSMELVQATDYLWVDADPAGVMEAFADEVGELREQVGAAAGFLALLNGGDPKQIAEQLEPLIDLPKQIARLQLRVPEDPSALIGNPDAEGDVRVFLEAIPVADTDFAQLHETLRPTEREVPLLSARDSLMAMTMNIDAQAMRPMFMELMTTMMSFAGAAADEEQMTAAKASLDTWFSAFQGVGSMVWGAESGMLGAFGINDPEKTGEYLTSDEYREFFEAGIERMGGDGSMSNEFEHEGVKVIRFETEVPLPPGFADQMPIPLFSEDGLLVQRVAIAGPYMLMTAFDNDEAGAGIRDLIAAVKSEEIRTRRSQDLMRIDFSLKRMADLSGQPIPTGAIPDELSMLFRKTDHALRLEMRIR